MSNKIGSKTVGTVGYKQIDGATLKPVSGVKGLANASGSLASGESSKRLNLKGFGKLSK